VASRWIEMRGHALVPNGLPLSLALSVGVGARAMLHDNPAIGSKLLMRYALWL